MDKFVTVWFTVLLTLLVTVGLDPTQTTAAIVVAVMTVAIIPMLPALCWIEDRIKEWKRLTTRQRVGVYPYDDWK